MEINDNQLNDVEMEIWEKMPSEDKVFVVRKFNQLREKIIPRLIRKAIKNSPSNKEKGKK